MTLIKNIALYLFAAILSIGLFPASLVHVIIDQIRWKSANRVANSFLQGAYSLDIYGNTTYASFLNAYFLKKGGYHFGADNETISSALGKNLTIGKLTILGEGCAGLLNLIDHDHCYKAISGDWPNHKQESVKRWKTYLFSVVLAALLYLIVRGLLFIIL